MNTLNNHIYLCNPADMGKLKELAKDNSIDLALIPVNSIKRGYVYCVKEEKTLCMHIELKDVFNRIKLNNSTKAE